MTSRAPFIHGYALASERPRRRAWYPYDDDPVVLPTSRRAAPSLALVISALISTTIIAGVAYAAYFSGASPLADTATAPLQGSFEPDPEVFRATTLQLLNGPALAVSDPGSPDIQASDTPEPAPGEAAIDDSQQLAAAPSPPPQQDPEQPPRTPYPNPVTTPPDAFGPDLDLNAPAPELEPQPNPENPY